ncbi:MAG: hypothetical protein WA110_01450 [Anaerolineaceae bacterium]
MKKKAVVVILVLMLLVLHSCEQGPTKTTKTPFPTPRPTTINQFGDGGLFSNESCGPPCFYGITPGVTTEDDAWNILQEEETVFENCKAFDTTLEGGSSQGVRCNFFVVYFIDSKVDGLAFYPAIELNLKEIIAKYGEPNMLFTFSSSTPDNPFYGDLSLCFDNLLMIVGTPSELGTIYHVSDETRVLHISYYSAADSYEDLCNGLQGSQEWEGYGDYPVPGR